MMGMTRAAFVNGVPSVIAYDAVRAGDWCSPEESNILY